MNYVASTREETISLKAALDKAGADRHEAALRRGSFGPHIDWLRDGDTLKIDYSFTCGYFGAVERNLRVFETLLADPAAVVDADLEEMRHGHSVLVGVVESVTRIRDKLARREAAEETPPAAFDPDPPRTALESALRSLKGLRPAGEQDFLEWAATRVESGLLVAREGPGPFATLEATRPGFWRRLFEAFRPAPGPFC